MIKYLTGLITVIAITLIASLIGTIDFSINSIINDPSIRQIWLDIRLPRIILASIIGAALAISGAAMQSLFKNPMAEPALLGIGSGAALAVGIVIIFGLNIGIFTQPIAAFIGAVLTVIFVFRLSHVNGKTHITALLLAGIAMNAFAGAAIGVLFYISDDQALRSLTFWMMGNIPVLDYYELSLVAAIILMSSLLLFRHAKSMDMLSLGDVHAEAMGINIERIKIIIIILTSLIVGVAISFCGIIGFVGLVIPHIVRLIFGATHKILLTYSIILGAIFLQIADTVARTVISPADLPIGIITGLIGGPFFMILLYGYIKRGSV